MVIKRAWDCYIQDVNNKIYIDTTMGSGAQVIGHNNPLIRKTYKQIKKGTIYTVPNYHTEEVTSLLSRINPKLHNEYIFCNTGTEANMRAIRLARAFTGKTLIGRFHGGWHGGLDGFIDSKGVPDVINNLIKILPYNDDRCFDQITSDFAAVIIEPVQGSNPREDIGPFLTKLREVCIDKGVLLIFDEVMTGFRLGINGGSGVFNVEPDIVTYGKVLGGGFPIGSVGGKEDIMKTKNVFYGGTFSANPLSMYSAKLILNTILNKKLIKYDYLNYIGKFFRDKTNSIFKEKQLPMQAIGCGPINRIIFTNKFIKNRKERDEFETCSEDFYKKLKFNGVFINTNGIIHLSMSHTVEVINKLVKHF